MREEKYVLAVGDNTKQRLNMLNQLYNPFSTSFLRPLIKPGMRILELACGFGIMSGWLAEQVGPQGEVIAIDISSEQLAIAKQNAEEQGHTQLKFLAMSVYDLEQLSGEFDLIYGRFILCHLTEPDNVLIQAKRKLKVNGMLVCDDMVLSSIRSYPQELFMIDYKERLLELYRRQEKDPDIGEKLPDKFKRLGLQAIQARFSLPLLINTTEKQFLSSSTREMEASLLATKAFSEEQLHTILEQLCKLEEDENYYLIPAAIVQCAGKII